MQTARFRHSCPLAFYLKARDASAVGSVLLGAIADGPDAKWFFRATGPQATLEAQRAAFDRMIRSIKRSP